MYKNKEEITNINCVTKGNIKIKTNVLYTETTVIKECIMTSPLDEIPDEEHNYLPISNIPYVNYNKK